mgnify:CR=1 FL=1
MGLFTRKTEMVREGDALPGRSLPLRAPDTAGAAAWLEEYALMPPDRARQRVRFFDQYRSYVINYNLGQDLVKKYIESRGGTPDAPDRRWTEFTRLLSSPMVPSGLQKPPAASPLKRGF